MKLKIKLFKSYAMYLLYCIAILSIAYLFDRFFQMLMFILFFELIQNCFLKRFHSDTIENNAVKSVKLCKLITIIIEIIYLIYCKDLDITIYSNLGIILIIATFNALLQFYAERIIVNKANIGNLEYLTELCNKANLSYQATNRLILKYVYKKTYREIADEECVEEETIKKSIYRSRKQLNL